MAKKTIKKAIHRNEIGRRYGRLVVISREPDGKHRMRRWLCRCDCGTLTVTSQACLRRGDTKSCGCLARELLIKRNEKGTHGESCPPTKEYTAWCSIKERCFNRNTKDYILYGARNIRICKRWRNSYVNFLSDVGRAPSPEYTLGRIDNDGNYEPDNVRWETQRQQSNNRRNNHFVTINNKIRTLTEWSRISGVKWNTIVYRLKIGIDPKAAVFLKPYKMKEYLRQHTEAA